MTGSAPLGALRVVVIGAGFGGLAATRALAGAPVSITLVDQRNHHLFQPLLYQVATAALSPADIAGPIRSILAEQENVRVMLDTAVGIDTRQCQVQLASGKRLDFDRLVIATGARHSYFGRDEWARHAPGLKTIEDATAVRRKVLLALEQAEQETDPRRRDALLTFVVIGGGPTGVEMAGAIAELAHRSVNRDFRSITPHCSKVILLDQAPRLLASFPEELAAAALRDLTKLGVEVRLSSPIEHIDADRVIAGGAGILTNTTIWAAGVEASPAAQWLGISPDAAGRVPVDATLRPRGEPKIFVIGDTAACLGQDGRPLPGVAPVAKQQGNHVARAILAEIKGKPVPDFRYRDFGKLATIGRSHAVADFGRWQLQGFIAWLLWSTVHVYFLAAFRNRLLVGLNLAWNYLTFARHARLITGDCASSGAPGPTLIESTGALYDRVA